MNAIVFATALCTALATTLFTLGAGAAEPLDLNCVWVMSNAPYCLNVLSAESNCKKGPQEITSIKKCLEPYVNSGKKMSPTLRSISNAACLVDELTDTASPKNATNCK